MYNDYFGFDDKPFALGPSPRFIMLGPEHKEALATLVYTVDQQEGWGLLMGEAGVGKTTMVMALLRELKDRVIPAVLTNPCVEPLDFFNMMALQLDLPGPFATKGQFLISMTHLIKRCREEGRIIVLVVDEAQTMPPRLLEEVRLLANLDEYSPRVLNILFVGKPTFLRLLKKANMVALMQRLRRYHVLHAFQIHETATYIRHRLKVVGGPQDLFTDDALAEIHRVSQGLPRLINTICDESLLLAFSQDKKSIDAAMVDEAIMGHPMLSAEVEFTAPPVGSQAQAAAQAAACAEPPAAPVEEPPVQKLETVEIKPTDLPPEEPATVDAAEEGIEPLEWRPTKPMTEPPNEEDWLIPLEDRPADRPWSRPAGGEAGGRGGFDDLTLPPVDRSPRYRRKRKTPPAAGSPAESPSMGTTPLAAQDRQATTSGFIKRFIVLIIVLGVIAGAYYYLTDDGRRAIDSALDTIRQAPNEVVQPPAQSPPPVRQPVQETSPSTQPKEKPRDWGITLPAPGNPSQ